MSIRTKFNLTFVLALFVICVFVAAFFPMRYKAQTLRLMKDKGMALMDLGLKSSPSIIEAAQALKSVEGYSFIAIFDQDDKLSAKYELDESSQNRLEQILKESKAQIENRKFIQDDTLIIGKQLLSEGKSAGTLFLGLSLKKIDREIRSYWILCILLSLVLLTAGYLTVHLLVRRITDSISRIAVFAKNLAAKSKDLTQKIDIKSKDETGELAAVLNELIASMHDMVMQIRDTAERVTSSSQQLSNSTQQVNLSSQEISNAIQQITKGATIQSTRMEETSQLMEKAAAALGQIMENAQSATAGVEGASQIVESGRSLTQKTVDKIVHLTEMVTDTATVVKTLGEKSKQIGEITETITSIADQTNLLALNAAIEAARAGEAGRGFAVVAEEVRKLAEGSAEAVRNIGSLINSIQTETEKAVNAIEASATEVQEGKQFVSHIANALIEIYQATQDVRVLTNQISEATETQAKGAGQIVGAISEVASIARDSASTTEEVSSSVQEQTASMQEMAASAQELARISMDLQDLVGRFKLNTDTDTEKK